MQLLLSSGVAFKVHTLRETEELALELGYDGLELMLPPKGLSPAETDRDMNYAGLKHVVAVHAGGDLFDAARYTRSLTEAMAVSQTVGARLINVHPVAAQFGGREHTTWGINQVLMGQRQTGLPIAYEVLVDPAGIAPERQEYFAERQAYARLNDWVDDVHRHQLWATLDTCHIGTWGVEPAPYIAHLGERLLHVHLSDYSRRRRVEHLVPGEGDLDLRAFLRELDSARCDITMTVELNPEDTPEAVYRAAKQSRDYIAQALSGTL